MDGSGAGSEGGDPSADKRITAAPAPIEGGRSWPGQARAQPVKINWERFRQENVSGEESPLPLLSVETRKGNLAAIDQAAGLAEKLLAAEGVPITAVSPDNARKLFFKPLNKHSSRESILTCLEKFGRIEYLRVPYSNKKRKNLGYGFVVFESQTTSEMLCRHQIKTKIDDKVVGFSKFDMLKYKSKRKDSNCSSDAEEQGKNMELPTLKMPRPEFESGIQIEIKNHFVKPTSTKFFSIDRTMQGAKYKYNLERLGMKVIRDTKSVIFLGRLRSTHETY